MSGLQANFALGQVGVGQTGGSRSVRVTGFAIKSSLGTNQRYVQARGLEMRLILGSLNTDNKNVMATGLAMRAFVAGVVTDPVGNTNKTVSASGFNMSMALNAITTSRSKAQTGFNVNFQIGQVSTARWQLPLAWTESSSTGETGYYVGWDTVSRASTGVITGYANVVEVGNVLSYKIPNLISSQTYFVNVTAHDATGHSSTESILAGEDSGDPQLTPYMSPVRLQVGSITITRKATPTSGAMRASLGTVGTAIANESANVTVAAAGMQRQLVLGSTTQSVSKSVTGVSMSAAVGSVTVASVSSAVSLSAMRASLGIVTGSVSALTYSALAIGMQRQLALGSTTQKVSVSPSGLSMRTTLGAFATQAAETANRTVSVVGIAIRASVGSISSANRSVNVSGIAMHAYLGSIDSPEYVGGKGDNSDNWDNYEHYVPKRLRGKKKKKFDVHKHIEKSLDFIDNRKKETKEPIVEEVFRDEVRPEKQSGKLRELIGTQFERTGTKSLRSLMGPQQKQERLRLSSMMGNASNVQRDSTGLRGMMKLPPVHRQKVANLKSLVGKQKSPKRTMQLRTMKNISHIRSRTSVRNLYRN